MTERERERERERLKIGVLWVLRYKQICKGFLENFLVHFQLLPLTAFLLPYA
jgi:hypothetical protein